ncbi:MAG: Gfo/Idh/MocA family oxidoreductase [Pseudomonadota bacterium]
MTKKLRLGIIGSGFITHFHCLAIESIREMEVSAIYSLDPEGCKKIAQLCQQKNIGTVKICQSISEVCQNADAVAIYSPNFTRVAVLQEIVAAIKSEQNLKASFVKNLWDATSSRPSN